MGLLVIGPQHGICKEGCTGPSTASLDSSWKGPFPNEARLLVDHIRRTVEIAAAHPESLLVFSGGDTQLDLPGRSEAQSAYEIARDHDWFGSPAVAARCQREPHARDSAQNAVFSTVVYFRAAGCLPTDVVIVGWGFKGTRFTAHGSVLKFLENGVGYVGVNNPPLENFAVALRGELSKLQEMACDDDWMLKGAQWEAQRKRRNPRGIVHPYAEIPTLIGEQASF